MCFILCISHITMLHDFCYLCVLRGLEVIEAHDPVWRVDTTTSEIRAYPPPEFHYATPWWRTQDSSVLAQLGWPDMRLPILYTLSWPWLIPTSEATWPRSDSLANEAAPWLSGSFCPSFLLLLFLLLLLLLLVLLF